MVYDVIIIGGGASGLACAVRLLQGNKNLKVALVDGCERLGKKLAATGNGQGNISNLEMTQFHFHSGNLNLVEKIACADAYAGATLFNCLFTADDKGRIYPAGKQASALVDSFMKTLHGLNISCIYGGCKVKTIEKCASGFFFENSGIKFNARHLVLCTGGKAQKQYGTDGSSYNLALQFGHKLTPLYPSLVQLKTDTKYIKTLKGIRADCSVSAIIGGKSIRTMRGDVIFTEYGVSGNAIFSISSYVTDKQNATLSLEFLPDFSAKQIEDSISAKKKSGWETGELLSGTLHNQIGRAIINRTGTDCPNEIVKTLKNFRLPVLGTLGFDYAQVTRGGIDMRDISEELESKLVKNLFFAGEVLDVDGDCGGYNLQWAFTSGMAVADAILKRI